ncbi:hypothetical protein MMC09_003796 [Bachmanniomyces sp. S44760]|nr:hypothetical protein [Bachmanniomyces sp. S44760]
MNGTPRLRSAFPATPDGSASKPRAGGIPLPELPSVTAGTGSDPNAPLIPFNVLDAPSQRLYVSAFYVALMTWRTYDYLRIVSDQTDSLWLFMKWVAIDGVFLYGLPGLKIPWLEWSSSSMTVLFLLHSFLNGVLMFRIPIPIGAVLAALTKVFYDRELAISGRSVKASSILHNASLILGKQIIHILPEGSAVLNPEGKPFCIDNSKVTIDLPLRINQTNPTLIELLRIDLETNLNETITISSKEVSKLNKQAIKALGKVGQGSPRELRYPVKKTGIYRLQRVVDESGLEVQRSLRDTLVVACPSASVKAAPQDRCKGQLSDFFLQVDATPPMKIKYSKVINEEDYGFAFLNIHPDNLVSPLVQQPVGGALVRTGPGASQDVSFARAQHVEIPLNETLSISGRWQYRIEEVHDACGNIVNYTHHDEPTSRPSIAHLEQDFIVHNRPTVLFDGCSPMDPLNVAKGRSRTLPIRIGTTGSRLDSEASKYHISYSVTPLDGETRSENFIADGKYLSKRASEPGSYTLQSISTDFCSGEVLEPTTCLLLNPPEPEVVITSENINDKCAGSDKSIGLLIDLDLIGSPPFKVTYKIQHGSRVSLKVQTIDRMRSQLELKPTSAGKYTYEFVQISDSIYGTRDIPTVVFEQDVKPPASASFTDHSRTRDACLGEPLILEVALWGEPPWILEYELVHGGKRQKTRTENIHDPTYRIDTGHLNVGGEYILGLTSVVDKSGCKQFLDQTRTVHVRHQRPQASFGQIENKRKTLTLEDRKVELPVRLTGEPPWSLRYRNIEEPEKEPAMRILQSTNDIIQVQKAGIYEIVEFRDAVCPGSVDSTTNQFKVEWISRPTIEVVESETIRLIGSKYIKNDVCQGDEESMEISLRGSPPFGVKYEQHLKPQKGSTSIAKKELNPALGSASITMDTTHAGAYEYKFTELGDHYYDHNRRKFAPLVVQQKVNSRPTARFTDSGKTYNYCKDEAAVDESIPVFLEGAPPFQLEIGIRGQTNPKPEIFSVPKIPTNDFKFQIPHRYLEVGTHTLTIRNVIDSHGCQRITEFEGSSVQVSVANPPEIIPLESTTDYCVGDRISYRLSGTPAFNVFYTFDGTDKKAIEKSTSFRRLAETPGTFTITAIADTASNKMCKTKTEIIKVIHGLPTVRISKGRISEVDIHEGGEAEILFEFTGIPPFEFSWTRSTNAARGKNSHIIETKSAVSQTHSMSMSAHEEGTYEVVSIKDKYCGFTTRAIAGKTGQQLLTFE